MRLRRLRTALLLLAGFADTAAAAANPYGLNAAWTECWGDGGTSNRSFACNTNTGVERLNLSFVVDQTIPNVNGMEMYLQFASESPTLPLWWSMKNTGTCRPTSLTFSITTPLVYNNCVDWGAGLIGAAGIGNYVIGAAGPNTVTTAAVSAVPLGSGLVLDAGVEYFTGTYQINHQKTVGSGACAGCQIAVCILYSHLRIFVDGGTSYYRIITTPANTPNSQVAAWQAGQVVNLQHDCFATGTCTNSFGCVTPPVTARNNTWGAVKTLYR